jgi:hypothetical protein
LFHDINLNEPSIFRSEFIPMFSHKRTTEIKLLTVKTFNDEISRPKASRGVLSLQSGHTIKVYKRRYGEGGEVKQRALYPNHVWSYGFDCTECGQRVRVLVVMDAFTHP